MNNKLQELQKKFPCRTAIFNELHNLIGNPNECYPNCIYIFGHSGTGKTSITTEYLNKLSENSIYIDCLECYMNKILFETILSKFCESDDKKSEFCNNQKCDTLEKFINEMRNLDTNKSYVICLDNAQRLRDVDANLLPAFTRLQEFTGLNICCLLLSQLTFDKLYPKIGLLEVIQIYLQQYSKIDTLKILLADYSDVKKHLFVNLLLKCYSSEEYDSRFHILDTLGLDVFENYLNIFLNVFYRDCRDFTELRIISRDYFIIYCEPILKGEIEKNDIAKLWRNIAQPLKQALSSIYMRNAYDETTEGLQDSRPDGCPNIKRLAQSLELPYYAKYLLIASFLASHNAAKEDKRLFNKDSSKEKKQKRKINAQAKIQYKMSTSLGPKSFTIDRLLAIFYAILDKKVGLTCNLLAQISTLVQLKFLNFASGESNIMEGGAKLQCTVGLDFISHIGKIIGFNVKQYLCDYM